MVRYVSGSIEKGIASGEFYPASVESTAGIIIAFVNGLFRRRSLKMDQIIGLKEASVDFCRRSLQKMPQCCKGVIRESVKRSRVDLTP